ncbi:MAG: hypothetical protein J6W76_06740, partial [Spirochaetales bacterium]|nr:hypothetical protein [Spirochaetales bacterium]
GQNMLSHGLALLQSHNVQTVSLDVLSNNTPAINLYCRNGFTQTGTIVTLRNETNSFYTESKNITLKKTPSLLIMPTLRMFNRSTSFRKDIYRDCSYLSDLTDGNQAEFVTVLSNGKTIGYFIFNRKQNILRIHHYGFNSTNKNTVFEALSALIENSTIVQLQIPGDDQSQIDMFCNVGFYKDMLQTTYIKKISPLQSK